MARRVAVIDCETDPFAHGAEILPFIWGFYDGETYLEFPTFEALLDYLHDKPFIVYAHNGGKFDYHFALDSLEPYTEVMIIGGRLAKFKIGACEFRDSINILPVALKEFEKDAFDYSLMLRENRDKPENREKISTYLQHDCENLYAIVTGFIEEYGIYLTQATAAVRTWQKIAKKKPPKSTQTFYEEYVKFYYGGRVQCFRKGIIDTEFAVYDINSAYPFAMLSRHPFSVESFISRENPAEIKGENFYTVRAISFAGALPFRCDSGLLFPSDYIPRTYTVTGWEIQAALDTESIQIIEYLETHSFTETIDFADYIMKFWLGRKQAKAEGDKAKSLYYKLLMNSLYGKFAANPDKYHRYLICDPADGIHIKEEVEYDETPYIVSGRLGKWLLAERKLLPDEKRFYNVATGASITGFVRAYLWRAIHSCGVGNMLYCDTDSIATTRTSGITLGNELGEWKNEGQFIKAGIGGKKLYIFQNADSNEENKIASKGSKLTEAELWRVAEGETVTYYPEVPTFSIKRGISYVNRDIRMT